MVCNVHLNFFCNTNRGWSTCGFTSLMSCMSRGLSTEKEISEKYGTHGTFGHIFLSPSHLACENIRFFRFWFLVSPAEKNVSEEEKHRRQKLNMRVLTVARSRLIGSCGYVIFKMAVIIKSLHENSGTRRNSQYNTLCLSYLV